MSDAIHDVFGGSDSELSALEDEPRARASPRSDGDYAQGAKKSKDKKKRLTKKKSKDAAPLDGEDGMDLDLGAGGPSRKRKRKIAAPKPAKREVDYSTMTPDEVRKHKLEQTIDNALKSGRKPAARPKKAKDGEEILDAAAESEVERMKEMMEHAFQEDVMANQEKLPATGKLRLLPQVMDVLQKASLAQAIMDSNLLETVRKWLEPLPDKSLPALNIQTAFFEILGKMDIDTNSLKESRLGRIVLFYTRCNRVTTKIRRQADALVATWSRPIIKRSASYRDKEIPTIDLDDNSRGAGEKLNAILARGRAAEKGKARKNMASIPQSTIGTYTVAPKTNVAARLNDSVDMDIERRKRNAERLSTLKRKVQQAQKGR